CLEGWISATDDQCGFGKPRDGLLKEFDPLAIDAIIQRGKTGHIAAGPGETLGHSHGDRIGIDDCDDRNVRCRVLRGNAFALTSDDKDVDFALQQIGNEAAYKIVMARGEALFQNNVLSVNITQLSDLLQVR